MLLVVAGPSGILVPEQHGGEGIDVWAFSCEADMVPCLIDLLLYFSRTCDLPLDCEAVQGSFFILLQPFVCDLHRCSLVITHRLLHLIPFEFAATAKVIPISFD